MVSINDALTSALSTNVLALNRINSQIGQVENRLATGLRVNSALDNPQNFFVASSLGSRSTQLNNTLDRIVENLGTLNQANDSVSSLSDLANQLKDVAEDAQEEINDNPSEAKVTGDRNLSGFTDLTTQVSGVDNGDRLVFTFKDSDGSFTSSTVTISSGDSTNDLIANINAITDTASSQVFEATLNSSGQLDIKEKDANRFEIDFQTSGSAANSQLVNALGFGSLTTAEVDNGTSETRVTASPTPSLTSIALFDESTNVTATTTSTLLSLTDSASGASGDIFNGDSGDALQISIDGGTAVSVVSDISTATVQGLLDGINNNGSLNTKIKASFDSSTGELNIRAIDNTVDSVQFELVEDSTGSGTAGKVDLQKLGIGVQTLQSSADGNAATSSESIELGPAASALVDFEDEFDEIRTQIDELVDDSEFDGINLLNNEDLQFLFNEGGTSSLTIQGGQLKVADLNISEADFGSSNAVADAIAQVDAALETIESFSISLANDLSIVESRQEFTENTIETIDGSIEDLTAVNEADDSALLLALQSRQQLSITALSLATQAQGEQLRLF